MQTLDFSERPRQNLLLAALLCSVPALVLRYCGTTAASSAAATSSRATWGWKPSC